MLVINELCRRKPTIKWYRQRLKSKFNAATTGEMLMKAVAQKLLKHI